MSPPSRGAKRARGRLQAMSSGLSKARSALALMAQAVVPQVQVAITPESVNKLRWLERGGRDFQAVTAPLLHAMGAAYREGLLRLASGRSRDATLPWRQAAEVFRDTVVSRLATGGGDVKSRMTPLRPATIERKGHSRIGVDSRALIKDVTNAGITVTGARMPKR